MRIKKNEHRYFLLISKFIFLQIKKKQKMKNKQKIKNQVLCKLYLEQVRTSKNGKIRRVPFAKGPT